MTETLLKSCRLEGICCEEADQYYTYLEASGNYAKTSIATLNQWRD